MDFVDWRAAQRIGERIAGSPPHGGVRAASVEPLARDFAARVSDYSLLPQPAELPALEAVDRPAWIAANLRTMRPLLAPLGERLEGAGSILSGPLGAASSFLLGAQIGTLTGMLSQRVLGQYDLALLDASVTPRLLLLAPNLAITARSLAVDRDELVSWVAIHEITHAVQFTSVPWLREHLASMLSELIESIQVTAGQRAGTGSPAQAAASGPDRPRDRPSSRWPLPALPSPGSILQREIFERVRRGELVRLTIGEQRWRLVERMQATMSLIEGHAEHVMDVVGADLLPSLPRLRAAMSRRRSERGLPWRVLERLLGLELKLRQYEIGRRFCEAVVDSGGPQALARAWSEPAALPTTAELAHPEEWLLRTRVRPAG